MHSPVAAARRVPPLTSRLPATAASSSSASGAVNSAGACPYLTPVRKTIQQLAQLMCSVALQAEGMYLYA
jgi:hypothetical protein